MTNARGSGWVAGAILCVLTGGCGGDEPSCDAASLAAALAAAGAGDVVEVGACTVVGSFTVPAGVTLAGAGRDATVLRGEDEVALRLAADASTTVRVRDLSVESGGRVGILSVGDGTVEARGVSVRATRGFAVGVEGAASVTLEDVELRGPVTEANADDPALAVPDPATTATYGLVLLDVDSATLTQVRIGGFAYFGATILDRTSDGTATAGTALTWTGGEVLGNLGTGLYVSGGTATLGGVGLGATLRGLRGLPTYGAVFSGGATVTTTGLEVRDGADYGLLHEGGSITHADIAVTGNGTGGILVGDAARFELRGTASLLSDNGGVNLLVVGTTEVVICEATVSSASELTSSLRAGGAGGSVVIGDGIQLIGNASVSLTDLVVEDNHRVGILLDLGADGPIGMTASNVTVRGTGAQLGAVAGITDDPMMPVRIVPVPPDGVWDMGIVREGATAANDSAVGAALDVAGIVTPSMFPRPTDAAGIVTPSM